MSRHNAHANRQYSFFQHDERLEKIKLINDSLWKLNELVDWEAFRSVLEIIRQKERLSNAGRPPYDVVFMFKVLVLMHLHNLSYEAVEVQILDRLSWMNFLGLTIAAQVPDATTVWYFTEDLKKHGLTEKLFDQFWEQIDKMGFETKKGCIIDSSFVEAPRRRTTKEENKELKENGTIPASRAEKRNVLAQTDLDADWAKKGDENHFGYKNHAVVDAANKLILSYGVTSASVHDVNLFTEVVPEQSACENEPYYADAGYVSAEKEKELRNRGYDPQVCQRLPKNRPLLLGEIKEDNRTISKTRCRVEHVFGEMKTRMGNETHRLIGMGRAIVAIGMRNLVYNMRRIITLCNKKEAKRQG
ncbi:MAG: IS5 family transposase [Thermoguttaceae bacterium]